MSFTYLLLAGAWILFYFFHSLLAANSVRIKLQTSLFGGNPQKYRLFYTVISILTFLFPIYTMMSTPGISLFQRTEFVQIAGLILAAWGVWVIRISFRNYSGREFLGLKKESSGAELQIEGILSYTRHPIYLGTLMIMGGYLLYSPTEKMAIVLGLTLIYILIGIQLEEKKLIQIFGDEYREYKKHVPMLIPMPRF